MEYFRLLGILTQKVLQEMARNHVAYWKEKGIRSEFLRFPKLEAFYSKVLIETSKNKDIPGNPYLWVSTLNLNDEPIAWQFGSNNSTCFVTTAVTYHQAYARFSPGIMHFLKMIYAAIDTNKEIFSFGRGQGEYKRRYFTDDQWPLFTATIYTSAWGKLLMSIDNHLHQLQSTPIKVLKPKPSANKAEGSKQKDKS